jgi:hypothetical protein
MKIRPTLALLGLIVLWQTEAGAAVTAGKYTKVFKGPEGLKVTVVHLKPSSEGTALIKFTGTEHRLDGHVLLYRIDATDPKRTYYSTFFNGARWTPYRVAVEWGSRKAHYLSLGGRSSKSLRYHEKESKRIRPQALLAEYRKQVKAGKIAKIQGLTQRARKKLVKRELRDRAKYYKSDCTFQPKVKVDWSTVSDEQRYFTDVTQGCSRVIDAMARLCNDWSSSDVKARVQTITCRYGKTLKASLSKRQLVVTLPIGGKGLTERVQALIKR